MKLLIIEDNDNIKEISKEELKELKKKYRPHRNYRIL